MGGLRGLHRSTKCALQVAAFWPLQRHLSRQGLESRERDELTLIQFEASFCVKNVLLPLTVKRM